MKIGFIGTLTIIFVICKLFKVIDWSWWWIFSPIWLLVLAIIIILLLVLVTYVIVALVDSLLDKYK